MDQEQLDAVITKYDDLKEVKRIKEQEVETLKMEMSRAVEEMAVIIAPSNKLEYHGETHSICRKGVAYLKKAPVKK